MNASFSQYAWESAKQDGCLPAPRLQYPSWPPSKGAFLYPTSDDKNEVVIGDAQYNPMNKPYQNEPFQAMNERAPNFCSLPPNPTYGQAFEPAGAGLKQLAAQDKQDSYHADLAFAEAVLNGPDALKSYSARARTPEPPLELEPIQESQSGYDKDKYTGCAFGAKDYTAGTFFSCLFRSVGGVFYDIFHYGSLPVDGFGKKMSHIFVRDDRLYYMGIWLVILAVIFLGGSMLVRSFKKKSIQKQLQLSLASQAMMPPQAPQLNAPQAGLLSAAIMNRPAPDTALPTNPGIPCVDLNSLKQAIQARQLQAKLEYESGRRKTDSIIDEMADDDFLKQLTQYQLLPETHTYTSPGAILDVPSANLFAPQPGSQTSNLGPVQGIQPNSFLAQTQVPQRLSTLPDPYLQNVPTNAANPGAI